MVPPRLLVPRILGFKSLFPLPLSYLLPRSGPKVCRASAANAVCSQFAPIELHVGQRLLSWKGELTQLAPTEVLVEHITTYSVTAPPPAKDQRSSANFHRMSTLSSLDLRLVFFVRYESFVVL